MGRVMEVLWDSPNFWAARQMLDASLKAQEVYAANLAHVNTPGYQRREVEQQFFKVLQGHLAEGRIPEQALGGVKAVIDRSAPPNSPSGNSVALARELQAIQSNSLTYDFLARYARGRFERLQLAVSGRT
jgi:flagellar basal-body rod protein FlgB